MRKLLIASSLLAASAAVSADKSPKLTPDMREVLAEIVGDAPSTRGPEAWRLEARDTILSLDMDGGGFSKRDIEIAERMEAARKRLGPIDNYMRCDLDSDGKVTLAEYQTCIGPSFFERIRMEWETARREKRQPTPPKAQEQNDYNFLIRMFTGYDKNGDGAVSLAELYIAGAEVRLEERRPGTGPVKYLVLDLNHDGVVVADEIDAAMTEYLKERGGAKWDARKPKLQYRSAPMLVDEPADAPPPPPSCKFPTPSAKAKLVRIGIYHATQISNVALAGQDRTTTVATIEIEPGREPLYIVASQFEAVVWKFTGAVDRIERFVVASTTTDNLGTPAAGAIGVDTDKFAMTRIACIGDLWQTPLQPDKSEARARMVQHFGRAADFTFGVYDLRGLKLPSGAALAVPENRPASLMAKGDDDVDLAWREVETYNPAGVAELDASNIVSLVTPERYETLPQKVGLTQLLAEGKIMRLPDGDYLVLAPIRYPAGLNGALSVRFRVKEGVPAPVGGRY